MGKRVQVSEVRCQKFSAHLIHLNEEPLNL